MSQDSQSIFKVIIIGEAKVGKTSILTRYTEGVFSENLMPTLGIDYRIKKVQVADQEVRLQIWDTAGQERFRAITQKFYQGADAVLLVFDLTDSLTFKNLQSWLEALTHYAGQDIVTLIVGNKCDLEAQIPDDVINQFCSSKGVTFFKASAKSNIGLREIFDQICLSLLAKKPRTVPTNTVSSDANNAKISYKKQSDPKIDSCC